MRREGERKTERGRELRAEGARPEQPDGHLEAGARHGAHLLSGLRLAEVRLKLHHVAREAVGRGGIATQRLNGETIRARCTAEAEIDAARVERLERPELLGDHERRV